ncbi:MAG: hypothetical protein K2Y32_12345 [Candidatus Obscuribacterales bacterium]|nr:hypothetical protein [Candidatus Obscuribacterales bacterium]
MYKPKKYLRLDKLARTPRLSDVRNLLNEAKKAKSCTVELPWRSENLGLPFSLTVRADVGATEPIWTLYEGEGSTSRVMWSTGFDDVELLYDVLTLSLPSDGPNIFAPTEQPKTAVDGGQRSRSVLDRGQAEASEAFSGPSIDRSYDASAGSSYENALMKPEDNDFSGYYKKKGEAKYPNHLMTEMTDDGSAPAPVSSAANEQQAQAQLPNSANAQAPASPAPVSSNSVSSNPVPQQSSAPNAHLDPNANLNPNANMAYPPYPYGYYPYGYPPGQVPPAGYPGYPYGYTPSPYPYGISGGVSGQGEVPGGSPGSGPVSGAGYGAMPVAPVPPQDPLTAASTVPISTGLPVTDPYAQQFAPQVVVSNPDLVRKRPNVMLGTFLVDAGLVPKATIEAALQVQNLVSQGTLSAIKAAEAVRRAHIRGSALEADASDLKLSPGESVVKVKPQIGQVLVMAGIISAPQLKTALSLQDQLRSGTLSMDEALQKLAETMISGNSYRTQSVDGPVKEALSLLRQSGLLSEPDWQAAESKGGDVASSLVASGKLDQLTMKAALDCAKLLAVGKLRIEQAVPSLHYCQRMRVPLSEALDELGFASK